MSEPITITDENRYRAAVGPRGDFYVPRFLSFDEGGSKVSWNWPAFFLGILWMLYRRMWSTAGYLFLISIALEIVQGVVLAPQFGKQTSDRIGYATTIGCMIVVGMFANALYQGRIKRRIAQVSRSGLDDLQAFRALERGPHTSWVFVIMVAVIFVVGILAAIAIPAYQDYTIRAQVTAGLGLADAAKAAVAESYARDRHWPADLQAAGMTARPSGKYIAAVTIDRGTVQITYGNAANPLIVGKTLSIRPTVSASEDVVWTCGYSENYESEPSTGEAGPNSTDVPVKYLPVNCRQ